MSGKKLIFITGITGYVGCHLAAALLQEGHEVVALVRDSSKRFSVEERALRAIVQVDEKIGQCTENLMVVPGDVQETADILLAKIKDKIGERHIDELWHCAATFKFRNRDREEVESINIEGVRHILQVVLQINAGVPPRYFHVSTAYSSGQEHEVVPEEFVHNNEGFRSLYEWSKYQGETVVMKHQREHNLDVTIFRPAIIVGSRKTKAISHSAYYQVCDALYRLRKIFENKKGAAFDGTFEVRLLGFPNTRLNFVPIDFVTEGMLLVAEEESLAQPGLKVFNVVNEDPPDMTTIHKVVCQSLNIRDLALVDEEAFEERPMTPTERLLARSVAFQAPYMLRTITFSTDKFRRIVPFDKLPIPQVDEEFLAIINRAYFDYLEHSAENGRK
jgi:nucleoside-diphosphate-sugar epimerase